MHRARAETGPIMRRVYFLLPDVDTARDLVRELDGQGFSRSQLHRVTAGTDAGELTLRCPADEPSDAVRAVTRGSMVGAGIGLLAALLLVWAPERQLAPDVIALVTLTAMGTGFGAWISSMTGDGGRAAGGIDGERESEGARTLMMVDVSPDQVDDCRELVLRKHPDAQALRIRRLPAETGRASGEGVD